MADPNIDQYRLEHESNKEWQLRRKFLEAHHDKFEERRLLCLASCFINVECYGCTYPSGLMTQLKELMTDIMDDVTEHREEMKELTAVKFVKAGESDPSPKKKSNTFGLSSFVKATDLESTDVSKEPVQNYNNPTTSRNVDNVGSVRPSSDDPALDKFYKLAQAITAVSGSTSNSISLLHMAADKSRITLTNEFQQNQARQFECRLMADFVNVGLGVDVKKNGAKSKAYEQGLEVLRRPYLQIENGQRLVSFDRPQPCHSMPNLGEQNVKRNFNEAFSKFQSSSQFNLSNIPGKRQCPQPSGFYLLSNVRQGGMTDMSVLHESAAFNKIPLDYDFRPELVNGGYLTRCLVTLGNEVVGEAVGEDKKIAKRDAAAEALSSLKHRCWTIRIKQQADSDKSGLTKGEITGDVIAQQSEVIPESNIGSKLLKKMGWAGGGVGKDGSGIAEPVSVSGVINRSGLGLSTEQGITGSFIDSMRKAIQDYVRSHDQNDMVFGTDFTKEERAVIHREAKKFGLNSRSYGKDNDRYLVLSQKRTAAQLFSHIMSEGGETSKYILIPPENQQES